MLKTKGIIINIGAIETDPVCAVESAVWNLVRNEVVENGTECKTIGKTLAKVLNIYVLK